jgi:RNA polymerase sigma factor (sigma-70 family)
MPLSAEDIEALYRRHARELLAFLARRTFDPEASVDLLAETFAVAFRDRASFAGATPDCARAADDHDSSAGATEKGDSCAGATEKGDSCAGATDDRDSSAEATAGDRTPTASPGGRKAGGQEAARAWLFGIARHRLADFLRRREVERRAAAALGIERRALTEEEYDRIEGLAATADLRARVAGALAELPEAQRDAVQLRVVDEAPYPRLAHELGITEQTARARVSRGLRSLRETIDKEGVSEHVC